MYCAYYISFKQNSGERFKAIWRCCIVHNLTANQIVALIKGAARFLKKWDSNKSPQLHRLARNLQFRL